MEAGKVNHTLRKLPFLEEIISTNWDPHEISCYLGKTSEQRIFTPIISKTDITVQTQANVFFKFKGEKIPLKIECVHENLFGYIKNKSWQNKEHTIDRLEFIIIVKTQQKRNGKKKITHRHIIIYKPPNPKKGFADFFEKING